MFCVSTFKVRQPLCRHHCSAARNSAEPTPVDRGVRAERICQKNSHVAASSKHMEVWRVERHYGTSDPDPFVEGSDKAPSWMYQIA